MTADDYRKLLIKYIQYVEDREGTHFLYSRWEGDSFTDEEWAELQRLSEGLE